MGQALAEAFRRALKKPNRAWNAMGPPLPAWFKAAVARIAPNMCWQFFPPRGIAEDGGVTPEVFPNGVWCLHQRLPRSGWLIARPFYTMADPWGQWEIPSPRIIKIIRLGLNLNRRRQMDRLAAEVEKSVQDVMKAETDADRARRAERAGKTLSALGRPQFAGRRIRVPAMPYRNGRAGKRSRLIGAVS